MTIVTAIGPSTTAAADLDDPREMPPASLSLRSMVGVFTAYLVANEAAAMLVHSVLRVSTRTASHTGVTWPFVAYDLGCRSLAFVALLGALLVFGSIDLRATRLYDVRRVDLGYGAAATVLTMCFSYVMLAIERHFAANVRTRYDSGPGFTKSECRWTSSGSRTCSSKEAGEREPIDE